MSMDRRGFLGFVATLPVGIVAVGNDSDGPVPFSWPKFPDADAVTFPADIGARKSVTHEHFAKLVLRVTDRKLRDRECLTVGPVESSVGSTWGSGIFSERVYAFVEDVPVEHGTGKIIVDKVLVQDLATRMAALIRAANLRWFGRLVTAHGANCCSLVENRRLALRFVTVYDVYSDRLLGRFDILGGV